MMGKLIVGKGSVPKVAYAQVPVPLADAKSFHGVGGHRRCPVSGA